jgi:hypothetical protein
MSHLVVDYVDKVPCPTVISSPLSHVVSMHSPGENLVDALYPLLAASPLHSRHGWSFNKHSQQLLGQQTSRTRHTANN